ncbi:beta-1,3-galactosyltransferase 1-like [Elysia marginata]|uniref:Hexosyltransferase n=1 Tax=Elysia marginata TaxID=1093978 RepID=A0AAV4I625_9GAST|nr:beta-1,3-galactosyltransferase 1-like [Elysia marginata]
MSVIKACLRHEWIPVALVVFILVKLCLDQSANSSRYSSAIGTLMAQEDIQTRLVSNFLQRNQLVSLLSRAEANSTHDTETAYAARVFYKRCFSRPTVNQSKRNSSEHPHFPGFVIENAGLCGAGQRVDVLVYVNSAVQNRERRRAIRHSWASHNAFTGIIVRLVFILGQAGSRREQLELLSEQASWGDIVQAKFEDTFRNLTFKAVTFMTWFNAHCAQAQYVVKVDDDMFVDMFSVVFNIIPKMAEKEYAMACSYTKHGKIIRDPKSHWYVESSLLAGHNHYPGFCPGFFSVITGNIIPELYENSFSVKDFIPVDDVYMTGLSLKNPKRVSIVDIRDQLYPNERSDPHQELKVNGHFEYTAFRVKEEKQQMSLWNLKLSKLSGLEQRFSSYKDKFSIYEKLPVIIK